MGRKSAAGKIEQALLVMLKRRSVSEITITELCQEATVSRSTFYTHFSNIEEVYQSLVRQMVFETSKIRTQLRSKEGDDTLRKPLCVLIREESDFQGLVKEDRFMGTFLELCQKEDSIDSLNIYEEASSQEDVVQALYIFQMTGCIATAQTMGPDTDWPQIKHALDLFIRGGLNAVRQDAAMSIGAST